MQTQLDRYNVSSYHFKVKSGIPIANPIRFSLRSDRTINRRIRRSSRICPKHNCFVSGISSMHYRRFSNFGSYDVTSFKNQ